MTYFEARKLEILGRRGRKPHRDSKAVLQAFEVSITKRERDASMRAAAHRLEKVWR